jgi:hypothetical protein
MQDSKWCRRGGEGKPATEMELDSEKKRQEPIYASKAIVAPALNYKSDDKAYWLKHV